MDGRLWSHIWIPFGCHIDTTRWYMALNFELVVSDQLFSVVLVTDKWFKIQRHIPLCSVNVTSKYFHNFTWYRGLSSSLKLGWGGATSNVARHRWPAAPVILTKYGEGGGGQLPPPPLLRLLWYSNTSLAGIFFEKQTFKNGPHAKSCISSKNNRNALDCYKKVSRREAMVIPRGSTAFIQGFIPESRLKCWKVKI